jgi:hypothetical protein
MNISALKVTFGDDTFAVELSDGRTIVIPLVWFPKLLHATAAQLRQYELSPHGIHWEALDEDISVEGLLAGRGDVTHSRAAA